MFVVGEVYAVGLATQVSLGHAVSVVQREEEVDQNVPVTTRQTGTLQDAQEETGQVVLDESVLVLAVLVPVAVGMWVLFLSAPTEFQHQLVDEGDLVLGLEYQLGHHLLDAQVVVVHDTHDGHQMGHLPTIGLHEQRHQSPHQGRQVVLRQTRVVGGDDVLHLDVGLGRHTLVPYAALQHS